MSIKERMAMLDKGKNSDPPPLTGLYYVFVVKILVTNTNMT